MTPRFRYEKAENEIKKKQLNAQVEQAMLQQHAQCKSEAESKFSKIDEVIAQIQLYQACMDYHISQVRWSFSGSELLAVEER